MSAGVSQPDLEIELADLNDKHLWVSKLKPTKTGLIPKPRGPPSRPPPLLDPSNDEPEADNISSEDPSSDEDDMLPEAEEERIGVDISDEFCPRPVCSVSVPLIDPAF
ncbi:Hypothetical protein SMAX5B_021198 [Scophthalmus maximus]|uniref:Uncharacterized protein n=1 Tax=Scophthalmus maximus TaxID=52904 RepID=A0A2U9BED0_SCOMX|nr:Hypothetical protein SMAX5B_021198 [Scophthalmus maximus]